MSWNNRVTSETITMSLVIDLLHFWITNVRRPRNHLQGSTDHVSLIQIYVQALLSSDSPALYVLSQMVMSTSGTWPV